MSNEKLSEEFQRVEKEMAPLRHQVSLKEKIEFYGLWCVAVRGKCNRPAPSRANLLAYGKYKAWKSKEHLTKEQAMQEFITKGKAVLAQRGKSKL